MANAEQRNHAGVFLRKAKEYLASAEDNLAAHRHTPAAGDAIHAGISAKDAIVISLTGSTSKGKDHATAAKELKQALGKRPDASTSEKALRELLSAKSEVEYGIAHHRNQSRITAPAGADPGRARGPRRHPGALIAGGPA
jgi:hypothetical protein